MELPSSYSQQGANITPLQIHEVHLTSNRTDIAGELVVEFAFDERGQIEKIKMDYVREDLDLYDYQLSYENLMNGMSPVAGFRIPPTLGVPDHKTRGDLWENGTRDYLGKIVRPVLTLTEDQAYVWERDVVDPLSHAVRILAEEPAHLQKRSRPVRAAVD